MKPSVEYLRDRGIGVHALVLAMKNVLARRPDLADLRRHGAEQTDPQLKLNLKPKRGDA